MAELDSTGSADLRPIPDPTALTTAAVDKAVAQSRDYTEQEIRHLRELMRIQFGQLEEWRKEQKKDTKDAVDAALAAAKEAVREQTIASQLSTTKSEEGVKEQLKQLTITFTTANDGRTLAHSDLKTRVERIENQLQGGRDGRASNLSMILMASLLLGMVVAVVTLVSKL